jgi:hypothetical protein
MKNLIRDIPLANGLTVQFFDSTRRYFGDYHQVRVKISCEVPLTSELFADPLAHQAALKLLGASVSYLKEVEQQGVATMDTSEAVEKVIRQFVDNSLGYFNSELFPKRFVQSELKRLKVRANAFVPLSDHG